MGWAPAYVSERNFAWQTNSEAKAAWISQTKDAVQPVKNVGKNSDYAYLFEFNLSTSVDPFTYQVPIMLLSDNLVAEIYVNGEPQSTNPKAAALPPTKLNSNAYHHSGYRYASRSFVPLSGFRAGLNDILIQVKSSANVEGLYVYESGKIMCDIVQN
jgi:hypothetical protein